MILAKLTNPMSYQHLKISNQQAQKVVAELYNIHGKASQLPGEIDFNFKIENENGDTYILKISRPGESYNYLDLQQKILHFLEKSDGDFIAPRAIKDKSGKLISEFIDNHDQKRKVRLLSYIDGRIWVNVNPHSNDLKYSLGNHCGLITSVLQNFNHPAAQSKSEWDIAQSLWTKEHLHLFNSEEKEILVYFQNKFESVQNSFSSLRKAIVHNDANNLNIIVNSSLEKPKVKAIIDFGDAIYTQIINDLAIVCAYAIMSQEDPLEASLPVIKGYHASFSLQEEELEHLYSAIAMRLVVTITKSALNKLIEPDNSYLLISEKPAWQVLKKWRQIDAGFALLSFRKACSYLAHPNENKFSAWAKNQKVNINDLFPTCNSNSVYHIDLSVSSKWIGHHKDYENLDLFQFKIDQLKKQHPNKIVAGGYLEPRSVYTSSAYDKKGNYGRESRTIHLGIDFWFPALTPVHALFDGEVVTAVNDSGDKEYGGLLILKHRQKGIDFFTLYGHNTVDSVLQYKLGDKIKKAEKLTELGNYPENGNWAPHLHFQVMLSMLDYKIDYPGVAYFNQIDVWKSICPDPNLLFKSKELSPIKGSSNKEIIDFRNQHLGKSLSLQYKEPIKMVRGAGAYLIDQNGRKYLDTVNNVAHVGHEHESVVKAGQEQMALINTNSRYLHENINDLTQELLKTLPDEISVLHFVNSGSEANELALRMVKAVTGKKDIIASEVGYHGNTNECIEISSYKFDGTGGNGTPEHTHIFPLPDSFRGKYTGEKTGEKYANEVKKLIDAIHNKNRGVGAFIVEPIISCGGQIELPKGFLKKSYEYVRNAGGLCISDEIQVGCGRLGKTFWGFELHDVIPDIVTIGKPLGNGHPLAAVACTQEVANKFANGMEYFNTFGGNPVSCAIGTEVLRTVERENLQQQALEVGEYLKNELKKVAKDFPVIGDVRGQGLFLGIELVDIIKNPLARQAEYLINRMKDFGILMSVDGPDNNVIKIKPPMVFNKTNGEELIYYLKKVIQEDSFFKYKL